MVTVRQKPQVDSRSLIENCLLYNPGKTKCEVNFTVQANKRIIGLIFQTYGEDMCTCVTLKKTPQMNDEVNVDNKVLAVSARLIR